MDSGSAGPGTQTNLLGRASECALLDGLMGDVRRGKARALVLRGEAGIGKTALLKYLIAAASDLTVVRAVGVDSEMELAYASLHQVCAPLLDRLGRLPAPQREALEIVFGLSAGAAPDRFLVGLGVLSLLSEVSGERPVLCVVDDAQWLDQSSALALAFVARRLLADRVGIVFAAREPGEGLQHISQLELHGLRDGDASALLDSALQFRLDVQVRDRILAETRGNPLALLELPRGLTTTELAGGLGAAEAHAVTGRIESSFVRRLQELPEETRRLVLIAAAEPVGDPLLLWRAAERLSIPARAAGAAEADGLLEIGDRVTFRHPLVRSAVYRSAPVDVRRAVHLALAEATDREADPDRRAWHLAAAAAGPDEEVALELERSAGRAKARGGLAAAAAFLQRAVALTEDPVRRADRALAAAEASLQAGVFDAALRLVATAEGGRLDEFQRVRVDLLRAEAAYSQNRGSDAPPLLLRAARALEPLDLKVARETYLDAWSAAAFAGRFARPVLDDVSHAVRDVPRLPGSPRPADLLLDGLALLFTDGRRSAAPVLEQAALAFARGDASSEEMLRWGWLAADAAVWVWDYETCMTIAAREVEVGRDAGALAVMAIGVNLLAAAVAFGGDFSRASLLITEADAVNEATGSQVAPYGALVLAAFQGRDADAAELIATTVKVARAGGQGTAVQYARWAEAVLSNALGRYDQAAVAARDASDEMPEMFVSAWALSELVEAGVRSGNVELASSALERLKVHTSDTGQPWARAVELRAAALICEGERADGLYREAIEQLSRTRLRPEIARLHLLYGEWLRRAGRRMDARAQLRIAHDEFTSIGMDAFAERAHRELTASGETARKRTVETRDDLTGQERQIAELARDGLSNPEIGARLYLSPRTVEWHLRHVFGKLGIRSRHELGNALPKSSSDTVPA